MELDSINQLISEVTQSIRETTNQDELESKILEKKHQLLIKIGTAIKLTSEATNQISEVINNQLGNKTSSRLKHKLNKISCMLTKLTDLNSKIIN